MLPGYQYQGYPRGYKGIQIHNYIIYLQFLYVFSRENKTVTPMLVTAYAIFAPRLFVMAMPMLENAGQ